MPSWKWFYGKNNSNLYPPGYLLSSHDFLWVCFFNWIQDFFALVPGWKSMSGRTMGDGMNLFPTRPLGPLRRKELEAKRTLFTRLSEIFIPAGGFGAQWQRTIQGWGGERNGREGGLRADNYNRKIQYLVESCSHQRLQCQSQMQPQEAFQGPDSKKEARAELGLFLNLRDNSWGLSEVKRILKRWWGWNIKYVSGDLWDTETVIMVIIT